MAQIIQHKRGKLEDLSGVTPNKAELLVVTGSSISALADGLVFVGNSSSDLTAVNRIITGSSTPNVTGGSYSDFIDGIPFYNTTSKKLEILAKAGNTNVVFTTNSLDLDGTGIVSSSAQVQSLGGVNNSTVNIGAGTNLSGGGSFTTNQSGGSTITLNLDTDGSGFVSGAAQIISLVALDEDNFASDSATKVPTQQSVKAYVASQILTKDNTDEITEGSSNLYFTDARAEAVSINNVVEDTTPQLGGNLDAQAFNITTTGKILYSNVYSTEGDLPSASTYHGMFAHVHGTGKGYFAHGGNWIKLIDESSSTTANLTENTNLYYTDTRVKTKLTAENVISGSSQVFGDISGDVTIASNGTSAIANGVIVNNDINASAAIALSKINTDSSGLVSGSSQVYSGVGGDVTIASNGTAAIASGVIVNDDINGSAAIAHTKINFDGSGLTSGSLGLTVGDGSSTDVVNVGVDTLVVAGTANEIDTAVTNNTVTIGLADSISGNRTFANNVTITGDLTVNGTQTIVDSTTLDISGSLVRVNYGGGATEGGLEVTDKTASSLATGSLLWDGTQDYWKAGAKASEKRVIVEGGSAGTANTVAKFDAAGTVVNSVITDDGSNATIGGELIVSGLVANSFVVTNASKQLLEVTPSTAGDVIQWNGSAFAASNVIDGGSF
jgi:hypothetical protein